VTRAGRGGEARGGWGEARGGWPDDVDNTSRQRNCQRGEDEEKPLIESTLALIEPMT